MPTRNIDFEGITPFKLFASYSECSTEITHNDFDSHIHAECEIYINVSGDVSFVVENNIYPIKPGSIIIAKPYEYHHCVYHSKSKHKHFWFLFSASENEKLFDIFFNRNSGENNLLTLPAEGVADLFSLCTEMVNNPSTPLEEYSRFFKLMNLLKIAESPEEFNGKYSPDVILAMDYIGKNFDKQISISDVADRVNVSINSLERHFADAINMTPFMYLRKKRLANAAKMLAQGNSVSEACENSGFTDYSNFIVTFKKFYGLTPLKYKNSLKNSNT